MCREIFGVCTRLEQILRETATKASNFKYLKVTVLGLLIACEFCYAICLSFALHVYCKPFLMQSRTTVFRGAQLFTVFFYCSAMSVLNVIYNGIMRWAFKLTLVGIIVFSILIPLEFGYHLIRKHVKPGIIETVNRVSKDSFKDFELDFMQEKFQCCGQRNIFRVCTSNSTSDKNCNHVILLWTQNMFQYEDQIYNGLCGFKVIMVGMSLVLAQKIRFSPSEAPTILKGRKMVLHG